MNSLKHFYQEYNDSLVTPNNKYKLYIILMGIWITDTLSTIIVFEN